MKPKLLHSHSFCFVATLCGLAAAPLSAAPITWTGAASTDFTVGGNWSTGTAPVSDQSTDIATFSGALTTNQPILGGSRQVSGISFGSGGWTLGGTGTLTIGTGGIASNGNNTITAPLSIDFSITKTFSASPGSTLTLNKIATSSGNNGANTIFGTADNTGTVLLTGGSGTDNGYLSSTVAYGTVILNKGAAGGTTDLGSAVDNLIVKSGATARYGPNMTDRNGSAAGGRGQVYGEATIDGTLDLKGNGTFSDNWSVWKLKGGNTGLVTNTGTGAGQLRIQNTDGEEFPFDGLVNDGTSSTALYVNINGTIRFSNPANTFSGGVEIIKGFTRFSSDSAAGTVPATPAVNITLNGANATLQNNGSALSLNANRNIFVNAGGGFKAGWSSNLTINGVISGSGPIKIYGDSGTVVYAGLNTHTGNTVLENNNSKLTLADDARMNFVIGTNGVNNRITGSESSKGTLTLNGDFALNLTNAELANGNSWTLIDSASVNKTYGATFSIVGFTEANDVWTMTSGANTWTYTESSGVLSLAVAGPVPNVTLGTSVTSENGGTILLNDINGGTVDASTSSAFTLVLQKNGVTVPATVNVSKNGTVTSVNFAGALEGNTTYTYTLTFPVTGIPGVTTKTVSGSVKSQVLPLAFATPEGSVGSWSLSEYPVNGANTLALAYAATNGSIQAVAGTAPVLNHYDPDTNGARSSGNFNNDFPFLSNATGDQNLVMVGKTKVSIPAAGDYTFSIHSDDGFAMRVSGGKFISKTGSGAIDPLDADKTLYYEGISPDSNTRGVYHFNAPGTYDILFVGYDSGGGGYFEVAWAPGSFAEDKDTNTWQLVGSQSGLPAYVPRYPSVRPGPVGTAGNFGVRTYLPTTAVPLPATNIEAAWDFLNSTTRAPGDADGKTVEALRNVLNANDPQAGGEGGLILPDSPFPGNTDVAEDGVVTWAKGRINVTTAGLYTLSVQADDGYLLRIKGVGATPTPGFRKVTGSGRFEMSNQNEFFSGGPGNTRGSLQLAVGSYDIEFVHFENAGGFFYELASAPGEYLDATVPPTGWTLVGYVPTAASVVVPKIKAPGWSVEATTPGAYTLSGTTFSAEDALYALSFESPPPPNSLTTGVPSLNYADPEAPGSGGTFPNKIPFPTNTAAADDNYAVRATGTLVITVAGEYQFGFAGDDGGSMTIKGGPNPDSPPFWKAIVSSKEAATAAIVDEEDLQGHAIGVQNQVAVGKSTPNSRTVASIDLQPGEYTFSTLYFEMTNGSYWEVFGAQTSDSLTPPLPLLSSTGATTATVQSGFPLVAQVVAPVSTPFNITGFTTTGSPINGASFSFASANPGSYAIQVSTDLANWSTISATITPVGDGSTSTVSANFVNQFVNTNQPIVGQPKLFVRVIRNF